MSCGEIFILSEASNSSADEKLQKLVLLFSASLLQHPKGFLVLMQPKSIITDFVSSISKLFRSAYFSQILCRRIQLNGLSSKYSSDLDPDSGGFVYMLNERKLKKMFEFKKSMFVPARIRRQGNFLNGSIRTTSKTVRPNDIPQLFWVFWVRIVRMWRSSLHILTGNQNTAPGRATTRLRLTSRERSTT